MCSYNLFQIFCFIFSLTWTITEPHCLDMKYGGILPLKWDDMAIVFYVTVETDDPSTAPANMKLEMIKCCEVMPNHGHDCETIELLPYDSYFNSNRTLNYTLIFPNVYPYQRYGECIVDVYLNDEGKNKKESRTQMRFDTTFHKERTFGAVKDYYEVYDVMKCKTIDLDPLDRCKPVDCVKKYSGHRNYLDKSTWSCKIIPKCLPRNKKDVIYAYDVHENICKEIQSPPITENDISEIQMQRECSKLSMHTVLHHVNCHNGVTNPDTNLCNCYQGWIPADMPEDNDFRPYYIPTFHTCNIHNGYWTFMDILQLPFPFYVTVLHDREDLQLRLIGQQLLQQPKYLKLDRGIVLQD